MNRSFSLIALLLTVGCVKDAEPEDSVSDDSAAPVDSEATDDSADTGATDDSATDDSATDDSASDDSATDDSAAPVSFAITAPASGAVWSLTSAQDVEVTVTNVEAQEVEVRWSSDLQGDLGAGEALALELSEGEHTLTATLWVDGVEEGSESVAVEVLCTEWDLWQGAGTETCYAETVALIATADATVSSSSTNTSDGVGASMRVDRGNKVAYSQYDLSAIPADATLTDVALRMWSQDGYAYGGRGWTDTYFVSDDGWDEAVTWDSAPAAEGDALGGWFLWYDGRAADYLSVLHTEAFTAAVERERAGDGLLSLMHQSEGYRVDFYAREAGGGMEPAVVVRYTFGEVTPGRGALTAAVDAELVEVDGARQWSDGAAALACWDYLDSHEAGRRYAGETGDGVYLIDPDGAGAGAAFEVWCDMSTAGGGWTLVDNDATDADTLTERLPGANADITVSRGSLLPDYAWTSEPQVLCRSSHSVADEDWVTLAPLRLQEEVESYALAYPTATPAPFRYSNGFQLVEANGLERGEITRTYVSTDRPLLRVQADEGHVCACNDNGGSKSGVGDFGDSASSTCSTWVR